MVQELSSNGVSIRWLGQAGFLLHTHGVRLLIDAWFSDHHTRLRSPYPIEDLPDGIDWLLATHEHADHLDLPSLEILVARCPTMQIVVPAPLVGQVKEVVPRAPVTPVQPGDRIGGDNVRIDVVKAWHGVTVADGYSDGFGLRADGLTPFVGYVIGIGGLSVYHSGDSLRGEGHVLAMADLPLDIAMLPVNGRDEERERAGLVGNMDAAEAAGLARDLGVRTLIPMHFEMVRGNTATPLAVADIAVSSGIEVIIPAFGRDLHLPAAAQGRSRPPTSRPV